MPELPEVETIVRQLDKVLRGKVIESVEVLRNKSFDGDYKELVKREIAGVCRRAKIIEIKFVGWDKELIGHLKMTGQLVYVDKAKRVVGGHPTADWVKELPGKHTRVIIGLVGGAKLFFNDMRVFGWLRLILREKWEMEKSKMPPDVVDKEFSKTYLAKLISATGKAIKLLIMDQTKVGGVGNIYANDALFVAGIRPTRSARSLTREETDKLWKALKLVIGAGIQYGGASASDDKYVNAAGVGGKYQEHFLVYQKAGEKCGRCGGIIKKVKVGGRGTFYCKGCQT